MAAEHVPVFREPEAELDEIGGFVSKGALLERRDDQSVPVEAPGSEPEKKLPGAKPPSSHIPGKGPLVHVYQNNDVQGWTFLGALEAPGVAVPARGEVCAAASAAAGGKAPPLPAGFNCVDRGQLALLDAAAGASPRFLIAMVPTAAEAAQLHIIELAALAEHKDAVRGTVPVGILRGLRQELLPDGYALLIAEESVHAGSLTGSQDALLLVDPKGGVARTGEVPVQTTEVRDGIATQRVGHIDIERAADGALVLKAGWNETPQVISTGESRKSSAFSRTYRWDGSQRRFKAEAESPPKPQSDKKERSAP